MDEQKIIEGNILLAIFMGMVPITTKWKHGEWTTWVYENEMFTKDGNTFVEKCYVPQELRFHADWNWLMPVVEKISKMAQVNIRPKMTSIYRIWGASMAYAKEQGIPSSEVPPITERDESTFILNTWQAMIDFINWHNTVK